MASFMVGVKPEGQADFSSNSRRYATPEAAEAARGDLMGRWFIKAEFAVVPSEDEPNV